jgi:ubiquinone biosynthesis accessory factor UbiJ
MPLKILILTALESALNRYLSLDENAAKLLAPLAGKIIAVTIEPFGQTLYLCPTCERVQCLDSFLGHVDTEISGTLTALGLMGLSKNPARSVAQKQVKISGDVQLGQELQNLFSKLDIHLEAKLAAVTGETVSKNLLQFFRSGKEWTTGTLETFKLNVREFLTEETRDLPAKPEAEMFYRQVDTLRMDYDRLTARVARLYSQLNHPQEQA